MKRVYLLPNLVTAFSLSCGLFIIFRIVLFTQNSINYQLFHASVIIMLVAAFADVCDGAIARILKAESGFGIQFDSLADSITFGVAPVVIILRSFSLTNKSPLFFLLMASSIVFAICGVLRLAKYNVSEVQKRKEEVKKSDKKKLFTGLPIPAAALAVVSLNLFLISDEIFPSVDIGAKTRAVIMICVMFALGYFMISKWKFPSIKTFNIRVKSFFLVLITAIFAVVVFYGIFHQFATVLCGAMWLYLIIAGALSLVRLVVGKKSNLLKDFEPDEDKDWDMS